MSRQFYPEYFPALAILDTQEILERIDDKWENPGPSSRHSSPEIIDNILVPWVTFCSDAIQGRKNGLATISEGKISLDSKSNRSYLLMIKALGSNEEYPQVIHSIQSAFAMLISNEAKQRLKFERRPIDVNQKLRDKIDTLVTNMYTLGARHQLSEMERFNKIHG